MREYINNIGYFKQLDSMMIEIIEEGEETIYKGIELIKCPINRIKERQLYFNAVNKLKRRFKNG